MRCNEGEVTLQITAAIYSEVQTLRDKEEIYEYMPIPVAARSKA
jgi:hypothetical protein